MAEARRSELGINLVAKFSQQNMGREADGPIVPGVGESLINRRGRAMITVILVSLHLIILELGALTQSQCRQARLTRSPTSAVYDCGGVH